jgi:hypothetical protein
MYYPPPNHINKNSLCHRTIFIPTDQQKNKIIDIRSHNVLKNKCINAFNHFYTYN